MEKALESVAQSHSNEGSQHAQDVHVEVVSAPSTAPSNPPTSPLKSLKLSSALKGIPKALLEKVSCCPASLSSLYLFFCLFFVY